MAPRLVLASSSPRRRDLLAEAGFKFDVVAPQVAELQPGELTARELTLCNALRKGRAVLAARRTDVVLAADTIVLAGDQVLGKPADMLEARAFLRRLSGRTHQVYSSVVILDWRRQRVFCDLSDVTFRRLAEADISAYFRHVDPLDKAGAYAAQGHGADIIERIDGSYTNVVGLPMERTIEVLRDFGLMPSTR